jgi:anti-sigma factor RsiW
MDCTRIEALLPFYPRGDLPRETFAAVTRHVAACPRCRRALLEVQGTYRLLQGHLNTAPAARPQAKAALVARLAQLDAVRSAPRDAPPAGAPVPSPVPVRRRQREEALPWPDVEGDAPEHLQDFPPRQPHQPRPPIRLPNPGKGPDQPRSAE